jgi:glycosyltransferase involved in cell wall biosynthesis
MEMRLKVLMSAYACEPDRGSEPEVGWRWALEMAKHHEVTVITRANNQHVIDAGLARAPLPHPSFIYYDPPRGLVWLKKHGLPVAVFYALWQVGARRHTAGRLSGFDLIHHITFNSFRQPGFWWNTGKPVVLGPLGGGQICPWPFLATFGAQRISEALRSLSVMASPLLPHLHLCFKSAAVILTANQETTNRIPTRFRHKVRSMLETAVPADQVQSPLELRATTNIRFIWVSRLEKIKACGMVLDAFALALRSEPGLRLSVVGPGPDEAELKARAERLGITESVTFHGRVPKNDIPALLRQHDVFIFSSVRDTSGNVLLEAMAAGLPAITLKHHGAAEIATDDTAIRIPPTTVAETTARLSEAMVELARSPDLRRSLAAAAHQRMREVFTWERKAGQMDAVYREVVHAPAR